MHHIGFHQEITLLGIPLARKGHLAVCTDVKCSTTEVDRKGSTPK